MNTRVGATKEVKALYRSWEACTGLVSRLQIAGSVPHIGTRGQRIERALRLIREANLELYAACMNPDAEIEED